MAMPGSDSHKRQKRAFAYDLHLIALSVRRVTDYAEVIGKYKSENGLEIADPAREEELIRERVMWARRSDLNPETMEKVFRLYMEMNRAAQEDRKGCGHFSGYL